MSSVMIAAVAVAAGSLAGFGGLRFAWGNKLRAGVAATIAAGFWYAWFRVSESVFGVEPVGWARQVFSPGWADMTQLLTLLVCVVLAPALAQSIVYWSDTPLD